MKKTQLSMLCIAYSAVAFLSPSAFAVIYLDENFETGTPFEDQNFPIQDSDITTPTLTTIAVQGVNLRSWDRSAVFIEKTIVTNFSSSFSGDLVPTRSFEGSFSERLEPGELLRVSPGWGNGNWHRFWQMAISSDAASADLDVGTEIGYFRIEFDTNGTRSGTTDVRVTISFETNSDGEIDIIESVKGQTIGTMKGGPGEWIMVSIIMQKKTEPGDLPTAPADAAGDWVAWDPLTQTFKGPQPTDPNLDPDAAAVHGDWFFHDAGLYIYIDSNEAAAALLAADIGSGWGQSASDNGEVEATQELRWELRATNGTLYVDDIFHTGGALAQPNQEFDREQSARMSAFDKRTTEPPPPVPTSVGSHWLFYSGGQI